MTFNVAQFRLTDDAISKFRRWIKKPRDCVINVMELLGIFNQQIANLCRIMVGDSGLTGNQIEDIFSLVELNFKWRFFRFTKLETLAQFTNQELQQGHAIFCGYMGQSEHVFLIAKKLNGEIMYVDPQTTQLCSLNTCEALFQKQKFYYILQYSPK